MHPEVEVTLLRAAQEALTNVARHARASRVGLTLSYMEDLVTLDVRDDGVGFDPGAQRLRADRHAPARRRAWAASSPSSPAPGEGTAISASVPARARMSISLLIVDDHPVVRNGLRGIFTGDPEFEVLGEASDGREAVTLTLARTAGRRADGPADAAHRRGDARSASWRSSRPGPRVLVLTTYGDDSDVLAAIDAGATGYLLKDAPREELLRGVRAAARGESVLSPSVAATLLGRVRAPQPEAPLSPRELEVLRLIARGATNREAAKQLFISEATVKTHLIHVYAKLGVNDRAAAVAAGYEQGLLGRT